ncbi:Diacylglycerol O-acyltransferase 2 [Chamberlinius hualienensis]
MLVEKFVCAFAVLIWTKCFILCTFAAFPLIYLLFTKYYYVTLLYTLWMYYDKDTCQTGGRRLNCTRWPFLSTYVRDYWPLRLIKTIDLDPNKNYVCGCHPHGLFSMGIFTNVSTEITDFSLKFRGITSHMITFDLFFWFPIFRDFFTAFGNCSSSVESIRYILTKKGKGNAIFSCIGGLAEIAHCKPNNMTIVLKNRKGFVKLAITCGADLVPVITFGENEMFGLKRDFTSSSKLDNFFNKLIGRSFHFMSNFHASINVFLSFLPDKKPVYTVVGRPIEVEQNSNPSDEIINFYHDKYIECLKQLFYEYKIKLGNEYENHTLTII